MPIIGIKFSDIGDFEKVYNADGSWVNDSYKRLSITSSLVHPLFYSKEVYTSNLVLIPTPTYNVSYALLNNCTSILSDISIRYSPTIPLASPIFS